MAIREEHLAEICEAAKRVRLEFVLVGNAAAVVQSAPLTTDDYDLFVRMTPLNLQKISRFAGLVGGVVAQPFEPTSTMRRVITDRFQVDFIFRLSERQKFESVRSRAIRMRRGGAELLVATLSDVIAAKEAAARKKDLAVLPTLRDTLRANEAIEKELNENSR